MFRQTPIETALVSYPSSRASPREFGIKQARKGKVSKTSSIWTGDIPKASAWSQKSISGVARSIVSLRPVVGDDFLIYRVCGCDADGRVVGLIMGSQLFEAIASPTDITNISKSRN